MHKKQWFGAKFYSNLALEKNQKCYSEACQTAIINLFLRQQLTFFSRYLTAFKKNSIMNLRLGSKCVSDNFERFGTISTILKTWKTPTEDSSIGVFHVFKIVQMLPNHATNHMYTWTGHAAPSPSAQIVCPSICLLISWKKSTTTNRKLH